MKKLNKVAALFASAALAAPLMVFAQAKTGGDNWRAADGTPIKNGIRRKLLARCQLDTRDSR